MASSGDCYAAAIDQGFKNRVKYFMQQKAIARIINSEATADEKAYSKKILTGQASIDEYAISVSTNGTIATVLSAHNEPTDNDLSYVVMTEMWDEMVAANN